MENYFTGLLSQFEWLKDIDPDAQLIGVGGSFRNLARIVRKITRYPLDMVHNYNIAVKDFNAIYDTLKVLDNNKKARIKGISTVRADVFPSALSAIKAFVDYMGFSKIVTSGAGIREGIMFNYAVPSTLEKPISDVLGHSLLTCVNHMNCSVSHADQVFNLSLQLFKQLRVLHKFPRMYIKVLRIAAYLGETGSKLKFYNSPKHSSYYILNSNLYGISHRDLVLAAYATDFYNKEESNWNEWSKYREYNIISDEDVVAVNKLAVMLRLAQAFDFSRSDAITEINCDVLGDSVIMKTEINGDASLEMKQAASVVWDFRKVFRKNLELI
jgi:exopolyphosphatase/guanosine-5'-triphosphate,3'-diphosphate pyrophosphatase